MEHYTALRIIPGGDGSFPEFATRTMRRCESIVAITGLAGGMQSGAPSVGVIIGLTDGTMVFAQTSLALFLAAADALVARHGDPRK